MIKYPIWGILNKLFSVRTRMLGLSIAVISVSSCGETAATFPLWNDHPANPMLTQASLPPQSDTLMLDPAKPIEVEKKPMEHQHHDMAKPAEEKKTPMEHHQHENH